MTQRLSWAVLRRGRSLWSRNATPGATVYGEALRRIDGNEHRRWDPTRSKIGSALLRSKEPQRLLPEPGRTALYLGAGHGTTISHLHDHLCGAGNHREGRLIAVDLAPRCMRDLTHLARQRPGIVPVLGDARQHEAWAGLLPTRTPWMFQDVAQAAQADIFIAAALRFLEPGGIGILSLKGASERFDAGEGSVFDGVASSLEAAGLEIDERISLRGHEMHHEVFVCRTPV